MGRLNIPNRLPTGDIPSYGPEEMVPYQQGGTLTPAAVSSLARGTVQAQAFIGSGGTLHVNQMLVNVGNAGPQVRVTGATWNRAAAGGGAGGIAGHLGGPAEDGGGGGSWLLTLGQTAAAVNALGRAARNATDTMIGFAQKASPSHVATFQGSLDLAASKIGRVFLPQLEELSRTLQGFSKLADTRGGRWLSWGAGEAGRYTNLLNMPFAMGQMAGNMARFGGRLWWGKEGEEQRWQKNAPDWLKTLMGGDTAKSLSGLPQAHIGTSEDYLDRLVMAGANLDQLQSELLKEQLQNLQNMGGLLERIERNTAAGGGLFR